MNKIIISVFFTLLANYLLSQNRITGVIYASYGINFYKNSKTTDSNHFEFLYPFTPSVSFNLYKNISDYDSFFIEGNYSARKIGYKYEINEPSIPLIDEMKSGQKYGVISVGIGYRRLVLVGNSDFFVEGGLNADFNKNVLAYNKGESQSLDLEEEVLYNAYGQNNVGEKSIIPSINLGIGKSLGRQKKYEIGLRINIPFKSLQTNVGTYDITWQYKGQRYHHQLMYLGKVYYLNLRFGYNLF